MATVAPSRKPDFWAAVEGRPAPAKRAAPAPTTAPKKKPAAKRAPAKKAKRGGRKA